MVSVQPACKYALAVAVQDQSLLNCLPVSNESRKSAKYEESSMERGSKRNGIKLNSVLVRRIQLCFKLAPWRLNKISFQ